MQAPSETIHLLGETSGSSSSSFGDLPERKNNVNIRNFLGALLYFLGSGALVLAALKAWSDQNHLDAYRPGSANFPSAADFEQIVKALELNVTNFVMLSQIAAAAEGISVALVSVNLLFNRFRENTAKVRATAISLGHSTLQFTAALVALCYISAKLGQATSTLDTNGYPPQNIDIDEVQQFTTQMCATFWGMSGLAALQVGRNVVDMVRTHYATNKDELPKMPMFSGVSQVLDVMVKKPRVEAEDTSDRKVTRAVN